VRPYTAVKAITDKVILQRAAARASAVTAMEAVPAVRWVKTVITATPGWMRHRCQVADRLAADS